MDGTQHPGVPTASEFKDRRAGLLVFGILEILFGVLAALMIALMIAGQIMSAQLLHEPTPLRQIIPGAIVYGIIAGMLIVLGIGSCKTRRWARSLSLIVAWSWLVVGLISIAATSLFLSSFLSAAQPPGQALPASARVVAMIASMVCLGIIFAVIPGILVFFYGSPHVKATCEAHDPSPGWTDACPMPVLALSLWLGFGAVTLLTLPLSTNGVIPFFGVLLSGVIGSLGCVGLAALWVYSAWVIYRLRLVGWWIVVVTVGVMTVSALVTFTRIDLLEMYRVMGYPERQIELMQQYSFIRGNGVAWLSLGGAVPFLVYLVFVKRYFRSSGLHTVE